MEILNFRPSQISTYGIETDLDGYRGLSWVGLTGIYADFGILGFWRPPLAYWNRPPLAKIVKSPLRVLLGKGGGHTLRGVKKVSGGQKIDFFLFSPKCPWGSSEALRTSKDSILAIFGTKNRTSKTVIF